MAYWRNSEMSRVAGAKRKAEENHGNRLGSRQNKGMLSLWVILRILIFMFMHRQQGFLRRDVT